VLPVWRRALVGVRASTEVQDPWLNKCRCTHSNPHRCILPKYSAFQITINRLHSYNSKRITGPAQSQVVQVMGIPTLNHKRNCMHSGSSSNNNINRSRKRRRKKLKKMTKRRKRQTITRRRKIPAMLIPNHNIDDTIPNLSSPPQHLLRQSKQHAHGRDLGASMTHMLRNKDTIFIQPQNPRSKPLRNRQ